MRWLLDMGSQVYNSQNEIVLTYLLQLMAERGILDKPAFKGGTCLRLQSKAALYATIHKRARVDLHPGYGVLRDHDAGCKRPEPVRNELPDDHFVNAPG